MVTLCNIHMIICIHLFHSHVLSWSLWWLVGMAPSSDAKYMFLLRFCVTSHSQKFKSLGNKLTSGYLLHFSLEESTIFHYIRPWPPTDLLRFTTIPGINSTILSKTFFPHPDIKSILLHTCIHSTIKTLRCLYSTEEHGGHRAANRAPRRCAPWDSDPRVSPSLAWMMNDFG